MYENPGDELYFGEVYRQVLQEAWLPEKAEEWARVGKSRRGRRPTQMGIYAGSPTGDQEAIRLCFSQCAAAWKSLPWTTPNLPGCDDRQGREYWLKEKEDRGVPCSYYDLYMRYCMQYCLETGCVMPSAYTLSCGSDLNDVVCNQEYPIPISGQCGAISLVGGPGSFQSPDLWTSPSCGESGNLYFKDANGATGCVPYSFVLDAECGAFLWPDTNPVEIDAGVPLPIYVDKGTPPFHWIVSGTDFSLSASHTEDRTNQLNPGSSACGMATILVTDKCGLTTSGWVRCTNGVWVDVCYDEVDHQNGDCAEDCYEVLNMYHFYKQYQTFIRIWRYAPGGCKEINYICHIGDCPCDNYEFHTPDWQSCLTGQDMYRYRLVWEWVCPP